MKKFSLLLACLVLVLSAAPAWAIPPFSDAFKKAYVKLAQGQTIDFAGVEK